MEQKFKIGDVVVLKSGGPDMTIHADEINDADFFGIYECVWFVDEEMKFENFHQNALMKIPE